MDLYQIYSNSSPGALGVPNDTAAGGLGFKYEIYLKIFYFKTAWLRCLKFGMNYRLVVLYQVYSNQGPRIQDGTVSGGPKLEPEKCIECIKNLLLQSLLA